MQDPRPGERQRGLGTIEHPVGGLKRAPVVVEARLVITSYLARSKGSASPAIAREHPPFNRR